MVCNLFTGSLNANLSAPILADLYFTNMIYYIYWIINYQLMSTYSNDIMQERYERFHLSRADFCPIAPLVSQGTRGCGVWTPVSINSINVT